MCQTGDSLVIRLANIIVGKQVETAVIEEALALICEGFSFQWAAIYEIDQYNVLNLKEAFPAEHKPLPTQFSKSDLTPSCSQRLAADPISYLRREDMQVPDGEAFLGLFPAPALVARTIVDERFRILGFLLFAPGADAPVLSGEELEVLLVLLSMLGQCVRVRTFQNKVSFAQTSLESILDNTGIDIYVNDFYTHEVLYANKSMAAPYGGISKFMGQLCWRVLFPAQTGPCEFCPQKMLVDEDGIPTSRVYTWDYQRAFDGSWFRVFSTAFRWIDGRLAHVVSSADITDNKRNESLIEYMANYDSLTALPNRRMLVSECEKRIDQADDSETGFLLFFDIDGFKAVNDTYGHDAGDEFLIALGQFFSAIPMLKEAIYRNGGDEFVAILDGDITQANVRSLASFIHARFERPWVLKKGAVFCNVSIGVACYPEDGTTAEALLLKADQAMYHVKKSGGGGICFGWELGK